MFKWDDAEKRVILYEVMGGWEWASALAASHQAGAILDAAHEPVSFIVTLSTGHHMPANAFTLFDEFARSPVCTHPMAGVIVIVTPDQATWQVVTVFCHRYPHLRERLLLAATLEEARALVRRRRGVS